MLSRSQAALLISEFASITDQQYADLVSVTLLQVGQQVGDSAIVYAAGHIYLQSLGAYPGAGPVTSFSAGDTSMSFGSPQVQGHDSYWAATKYGVQYLRLRAQKVRIYRSGV